MKVTKLEKTRRERGLNKSELARIAEMQPGIIGWIEEGRFKPYDSQLVKLADKLNFEGDPHDLLQEVEA